MPERRTHPEQPVNPEPKSDSVSRRDFLKKALLGAAGFGAGVLADRSFSSSEKPQSKDKQEVLKTFFDEEKSKIQSWEEQTQRIPENIRMMEEPKKTAWSQYEEIRTRLYAKQEAYKSIYGDSPDLDKLVNDLEGQAYRNYQLYEEEKPE